MKVGLVALHFPRPEHRDEMISRVHRAAEQPVGWLWLVVPAVA